MRPKILDEYKEGEFRFSENVKGIIRNLDGEIIGILLANDKYITVQLFDEERNLLPTFTIDKIEKKPYIFFEETEEKHEVSILKMIISEMLEKYVKSKNRNMSKV